MSGTRQHLYVIQQIFLRDLQATLGICGLKVFKRKTPAFNCLLPEVNPTKAEPACTIVEYPAFTRESGFRFMG